MGCTQFIGLKLAQASSSELGVGHGVEASLPNATLGKVFSRIRLGGVASSEKSSRLLPEPGLERLAQDVVREIELPPAVVVEVAGGDVRFSWHRVE